MTVRISVIMTAHNRRQFLPRALKSIEEQTLDKSLFEVIVVKNFTDNTVDEFIKNHNFRHILVAENTPQGFDLAEGISNAKGEVITFLEDDDVYSPQRLARIFESFRDPRVSFFKNRVYLLAAQEQTHRRRYRFDVSKDRFVDCNRFPEKLAYFNHVKVDFNLTSIAFKRDLLNDDKLIYLRDKITHAPDTFVFCCAISYGSGMFFCKDPLTGYGVSNSASRRTENTQDAKHYMVNIYDIFLDKYKEFCGLFPPIAQNYLRLRTCNLAIIREIIAIKNDIQRSSHSIDFACIKMALSHRDFLLFYDMLRFLKASAFRSLNKE